MQSGPSSRAPFRALHRRRPGLLHPFIIDEGNPVVFGARKAEGGVLATPIHEPGSNRVQINRLGLNFRPVSPWLARIDDVNQTRDGAFFTSVSLPTVCFECVDFRIPILNRRSNED